MKFGTKLIAGLTPQDRPYEARDSDLPGLLIRVQPSGVQTYYCEYRNRQNLKQRIKLGRVGHLTLPQARDEARKVLGAAAQGADPAHERKRDRLMSFKLFVENDYGDHVKASHRDGQATVKCLLSRFKEFESNRLDEITAWKIERWIGDRKRQGLRGTTINRNIATLKACLNRAVDWKLIDQNPIRSVRLQRVDHAGIVRYLTDEEVVRLHMALDDRESRIIRGRENGNVWRLQRGVDVLPSLSDRPFVDYLKPMILLSLNLGVRQGELFQAKWSDVSFENRTITIRGQISKSGKTRHIPLNQTAHKTLSMWRMTSPDSELIFPGKAGGAFNNVKRAWMKLLLDAQVTGFRWHDMRHHFASRLVMNGVDLNTVRELLGHSDIKMTLRYAHLSPRVMAEAVSRLDVPHPIDKTENVLVLG